MQQALKRVKGQHTLLLAVALVLSFTKLSLFALFAVIIGWAWVSRKVFEQRLYGAWLTHLFIGLLAFTAFNSVIAILCRIAGVSVPLPLIIAANSLALIGGMAYAQRTATASADNIGPIKAHWVLISGALLIMATFTLPVMLHSNTGNLLHYSVYGYDDAAHLQMYRANIYAQGFVSEVDKEKQPDLNIERPVVSYPQGLHFTLSLFARGVFQLANTQVDNVHHLLLTYRVGMALFYGALIVMIIEIAAQIVSHLRRLTSRRLGIISELGIVATGFTAYNTLVYPQISYAGQSFLTTVAMLAGTLLALLLFDRSRPALRWAAFGFASLFAVGVAYTWILSMIVAFSALALMALRGRPATSLLAYLRQLQNPVRFNYRQFSTDYTAWLYIAVAGLLCLPQLIILATDTNTDAGALNNEGGIASPDHGRYMVLLLALIVGLIFAAIRKPAAETKTSAKQLLDTGLVLLSPLLLVLFFYSLQMATTGQLSYYFTKTTYMAYIVLIVAAGAVATYLISRTENVLGKLRALYLGILLFGVFAMYLSVGRGFMLYARGINYNMDQRVTQHAGRLIDEGVRPRDIVSYTRRTYEEDMFMNLIANQIDQYRPENRHVITILAQQKRYDVFKQFVADYTKRDTRTYILVSKATEREMRKALPADGNYELVVVNK